MLRICSSSVLAQLTRVQNQAGAAFPALLMYRAGLLYQQLTAIEKERGEKKLGVCNKGEAYFAQFLLCSLIPHSVQSQSCNCVVCNVSELFLFSVCFRFHVEVFRVQSKH